MPVIQAKLVYEHDFGDYTRKYDVQFYIPFPDIGDIKETEDVSGLSVDILFNDQVYTLKSDQLKLVLIKDAIDAVHVRDNDLDDEYPPDEPDETGMTTMDKIFEYIAEAKTTADYKYDPHHDCYCKTRRVCGCGCDPKHDGW